MVRWLRVSSGGSGEGQTGTETQGTSRSTGRLLALRQPLAKHLLPFAFFLLNPGEAKIRELPGLEAPVFVTENSHVTRGSKHFKEGGWWW